MRLCYALLYYDPRAVDDDPRVYLERVRSAHDLPQALAARGHEVCVVHLYPFETEALHERVRHLFVAPGNGARSLAKLLAGTRSVDVARFTPAWRAISRLLDAEPDVIHFFGTSLHLNLALLAWRRGRERPAIVLHFHGGGPARGRVARRLQAYGFAGAARVVFTTRDQAQSHARAGLIPNGSPPVVRMMETSSRFRRAPRTLARARTGMSGDPVFLWTARLDSLKDPMTALRGFARIAARRERAELYLYYREGALLTDLTGWVGDHPAIRDRIHFCGRLPYSHMEEVYNSADFLLQASTREHSGCSVLDAMACGTIPVVTDIPSFREMTGDGEVGILFPPGDDAAMARQVLEISPLEIEARSAAVLSRFESQLSFAALARGLERVYEEVAR